MTTLECIGGRGLGAWVPRGAERAGAGADLGWRDPAAAAMVRGTLERRGKEEKRWNVLENRVGGCGCGMGGEGWGMGNEEK